MDNKDDSAQLNIYLLGQPRIMAGERPVLTELTTKAMVLILYLAASGEKAYSREVLSEMLWPELPMENSKSNLRQVLSSIKKAWCMEFDMEESLISADKGTCSLNCQMEFFVDLPAFYKGAKRGLVAKDAELLQESIDLYRGSFLEGFYVKGSALIDEWILFERESVSRALRESSKALAAIYEEKGNFEKALHCLNKLIKTDVLQEDVYRELMRIQHKSGNRNQAIALYNQCTRILRKELNISPMEETKRLYMQIVGDGSSGNKDEAIEKGQQGAGGSLSFGNNFLVHVNQQGGVIQRLEEEGRHTQEILLKANPFGGAAYEGMHCVIEEILESKVVTASELGSSIQRFFPELGEDVDSSKEIYGVSEKEVSESAFVGMVYSVRRLLEKTAEKIGGLLITIVEYERLDENTKKFICYLLGNCKSQSLYLVIGYSDEEKIQELQKGFKYIVM